MSAALLLEELTAAGVELEKAGEKLKCRAPEGALTPAILASIRLRKHDLLALLEGAPAAVGPVSRGNDGKPVNLAAIPTAALAAWLRGLRLYPEPNLGSVRQRCLPKPTAPPYCLDLADCLDRLAAGTANPEDALRVAAWLPQGAHAAFLLHERDLDQSEPLLRELYALEEALRDAGVPVIFPQRAVTREKHETPAAAPAGA